MEDAMRELINYIRSCFCKHELELIAETEMYWSLKDNIPLGMKWTYRCKKCGWIKTYKNY